MTADTRRPVKFVDSVELAYVMTRYRDARSDRRTAHLCARRISSQSVRGAPDAPSNVCARVDRRAVLAQAAVCFHSHRCFLFLRPSELSLHSLFKWTARLLSCVAAVGSAAGGPRASPHERLLREAPARGHGRAPCATAHRAAAVHDPPRSIWPAEEGQREGENLISVSLIWSTNWLQFNIDWLCLHYSVWKIQLQYIEIRKQRNINWLKKNEKFKCSNEINPMQWKLCLQNDTTNTLSSW